MDITVVVSDELYRMILKLQKENGLKSVYEVIADAIETYHWVVMQQKQGKEIVARTRRRKREK